MHTHPRSLLWPALGAVLILAGCPSKAPETQSPKAVKAATATEAPVPKPTQVEPAKKLAVAPKPAEPKKKVAPTAPEGEPEAAPRPTLTLEPPDKKAETPGEEKDPFAPTYGKEVEREAVYLVAPVAGGKRLQAGTLLFDDGEEWIVSYRPSSSKYQFVEKRVKVKGRPYWPSSQVQHVGGTHFELAHMELAPGEKPYDPLPTKLPAPAQVRTKKELEARVGRYAHCVGKLTKVEPLDGDNPYWSDGAFQLADGTELKVEGIPGKEPEFKDLVGKPATLLVTVMKTKEGLALGARTICPGEVERCKMTEDNARK